MGEAEEPVNWLERRKQRTRSSNDQGRPVDRGQAQRVLFVRDHPIADVGMGSFYNHNFDSKKSEAAVADVLDSYGAVLDSLTIRYG